MNNPVPRVLPPDQHERELALDPSCSLLVQAPAGSGKTDLLTRRFLRLLAEVDEPGQVVAITFTNAAAAEMRHRILAEIENAAKKSDAASATDHFSMESLARRALERSQQLGWNLLDLPSQLRISTIDAFCRDLALKQPLLSRLGGSLDIAQLPTELYRRAARETLHKIDEAGSSLATSIEALLLWRDNNWHEMEELLVAMLGVRDRWMHGFILERDPDWNRLREQLERPFARAVHEALTQLSQLLDQAPGAREEALTLARFACEQSGGLHRDLAELTDFPIAPFNPETLEEARQLHLCFADLLLIGEGKFRKAVDKRLGFPADRKPEKARILGLIATLAAIPGLEAALTAVRNLPPARYTEEDWQIVQACFTLLRHAAGELQIAFAEAGTVDFIEIAQIAQSVLRGHDGLPTDAALAISDGIRHLLVDEFQDTSRRQHQLLSSLIAAWPERHGRTCFAVGDPMQSIYFFRDADAELFPRVAKLGLEVAHDEPLLLAPVRLSANFRTAPSLVNELNRVFFEVFAANDGSGITFSSVEPARAEVGSANLPFQLHLDFVSQSAPERESARELQIAEIVAFIQSQMSRVEEARAKGEKFRVAILGRTRSSLAQIAQALRRVQLPFRAVDLESLADRPEVLDALALARAVLNPQDRVAWLGVLRAPWCGLSLDDLYTLAGDPNHLRRPVPDLLIERVPLLSREGHAAGTRVLHALTSAAAFRAAQPAATLGTRLEQLWLHLGGAACVDRTALANVNLLWSCLDRLPGGEADLLSPALDAALSKLTALPDPAANSDCGVQLMTIHKSKGLEFEVVIVPELQAAGRVGARNLLSWLERGLAEPDDSGEITEFLIAPLQSKGTDKGKAKAWVDRIYRERESQEMRRILYVVATRAREQLHLFARPTYKAEADGTLSLVEPTNSLLATAWPALEAEVRARFAEWSETTNQVIEEEFSIAAAAETNLRVMPAPIKPTILRRLPLDFKHDA
jgi:ATP-dependent exoDNAse (exonuclease V) beta subunit